MNFIWLEKFRAKRDCKSWIRKKRSEEFCWIKFLYISWTVFHIKFESPLDCLNSKRPKIVFFSTNMKISQNFITETSLAQTVVWLMFFVFRPQCLTFSFCFWKNLNKTEVFISKRIWGFKVQKLSLLKESTFSKGQGLRSFEFFSNESFKNV